MQSLRYSPGFVLAFCLSAAATLSLAAAVVEDSAFRSVSSEACGSLLPVEACDSPVPDETVDFGDFTATSEAFETTDGAAEAQAFQDSSIGAGDYRGTLTVAADANATFATGFQISEGSANSQFNLTFTLDTPTDFNLAAVGSVFEGDDGFVSARAQLVITGTPLGMVAYNLQFTSTADFDETVTVNLPSGTYLLFVEVDVSAQAQGVDGPATGDASIDFIVTTGSLSTDPTFRRGDVNSDGSFDISDPVSLLSSLFVTGSPEPFCAKAADLNDDGVNDISDAVSALSALFVTGAPAPPPPGATSCGVDPTPDGLDCFDGSPCP